MLSLHGTSVLGENMADLTMLCTTRCEVGADAVMSVHVCIRAPEQKHSMSLAECAYYHSMQAYKLFLAWCFLAAFLLITENGYSQIQMAANLNHILLSYLLIHTFGRCLPLNVD